MNKNRIDNLGDIATTINILNEASKRNEALSVLVNSPLPDEIKTKIFLSYKKLKYKQMIILPLLFIGWFIFIILSCFIVDSIFKGKLYYSINSNLFLQFLGGAIIVLPIYVFFKLIFKGDTYWDIYYDWYKTHKSSHFNTVLLLHCFGIEEESAEESNDRIMAEMKSQGKSKQQIEAVLKSRSDYQLKMGLRPETEEEENNRIRKQMKENGYTDEQINKVFSE